LARLGCAVDNVHRVHTPRRWVPRSIDRSRPTGTRTWPAALARMYNMGACILKNGQLDNVMYN